MKQLAEKIFLGLVSQNVDDMNVEYIGLCAVEAIKAAQIFDEQFEKEVDAEFERKLEHLRNS